MFMKPFQSVLAVVSLLAVILIVVALVRPGAKPGPQASTPSSATITPAVTAGLKVHVDPITGRIAPPPAGLAPDPAAKQPFNSSHEGLVEEPGPTAAGGFKVDTRGRFQSAVLVSVGADGKPVLQHVDGPAGPPPAR